MNEMNESRLIIIHINLGGVNVDVGQVIDFIKNNISDIVVIHNIPRGIFAKIQSNMNILEYKQYTYLPPGREVISSIFTFYDIQSSEFIPFKKNINPFPNNSGANVVYFSFGGVRLAVVASILDKDIYNKKLQLCELDNITKRITGECGVVILSVDTLIKSFQNVVIPENLSDAWEEIGDECDTFTVDFTTNTLVNLNVRDRPDRIFYIPNGSIEPIKYTISRDWIQSPHYPIEVTFEIGE